MGMIKRRVTRTKHKMNQKAPGRPQSPLRDTNLPATAQKCDSTEKEHKRHEHERARRAAC